MANLCIMLSLIIYLIDATNYVTWVLKKYHGYISNNRNTAIASNIKYAFENTHVSTLDQSLNST